MARKFQYISLIPMYLLVLVLVSVTAMTANHAITAAVENTPINDRVCVIIDPGHGGIDGGAISCNGNLESHINLEISMRLDDLMHLLGIQTIMTRKSDISIHTAGESIAQKKVSDLKHRVKIVNDTPNALLISIHQNQFTDRKYSGAQVFYAATQDSKALAVQLQENFKLNLNSKSKRQAKKADGVYLMQNINCTGVLVECGFLSNYEEEAKLREAAYQKRICSIIATTTSQYLNSRAVA